MWGLPQACILANKRLCRKLALFGYYECVNTPGLWTRKTRPILFTLVVDDFGVKYVNQADVDHLIASVKQTYTLTEDWSGDLYCVIKLDWDYVNQTVDIFMPGYIKKKLQEYEHIVPKKPQHCPYSPEPKQFGSKAQRPLRQDSSQLLDEKRKWRVQQIVGSILYCARAVGMTVLMALSTIAMSQAKPTKNTMDRCVQCIPTQKFAYILRIWL